MDGETLKWLLTMATWGVVFWVMMRYGCGAHMFRGRHVHQGHGGTASEVKDPVCGMSVRPQASAAAAVYRGETYYFCSRNCRDRFEASPGRYGAGASDAHPHA